MSVGQITYRDGRWRIECAAHVRTKLRRLFPEASQRAGETITLSDNDENCRDLLWFLGRYPMDMEDSAADRLRAGSSRHVDEQDQVAALLEGRHPPGDFALALPPRDYQIIAAQMLALKRGLLLADDVGVGKTVTGICPMAHADNLPALVVTLTHLPHQWAAEIKRFAPQLQVHILKSGRPYDLIPKRSKQSGETPRLPDVIITNYHKLSGWSETLAGVVRYVVFDETQELRRSDSNKYAAAKHVAQRAALKVGLSVGPRSELELKGGPFGGGWIGSIEEAWQLLDKESAVSLNGYDLVRVDHIGVMSRGWTMNGFAWKPVRKFIRHRCTKPVRTLNTGGVSLVVTDDHSVFEVGVNGLASKSSDAFAVGDLLAADNGAGWESDKAEELPVDVLSIAAGIPRSQVVVDLSNVSRHQLGLTAWEWQNCHREATYGPRLPIGVYLKHRDILPQPTAVYIGRGKAPAMPPKVKLSGWAYVLGFYLGDGWTTRDRVNFAVEADRSEAFCRALDALGLGLRPLITKRRGASVEIRCSNRMFATLILQVIGNAKCFEKRIPAEWITTWPRAARRSLLDGLIDSDGHIAKRGRSRLSGSFVTTSLRLALDVQVLLRSIGVTGGLHVRKPINGGEVSGRRIVGKRDSCRVHWPHWAVIGDSSGRRGKRSRYAWTKGRLNEVPLRSVANADLPEHVYDLEMAGHPSFTVNGLLVHNSATPIYNYGEEFFNVLEVLRPAALGTREEFSREWCANSESIKDPQAFGEYLRREGLMLRRTRADVGRELPPVSKVPQVVDTDPEVLERVQGSAAELARTILATQESYRGQKFRATEEFNVLMRQATGIAKAPFAAQFVRLLLESEKKIILYGWHRECYALWMEQLSEFHPRLYTGSESPRQKEEAKETFLNGDCRLLIVSLRAGAGVDGLQKVCRTVVFGELDWSPGVHEQCIGRIARDGQVDPVVAYYLVAESGADPIMADVLGIKRSQIEGVRDPDGQLVERLDREVGAIRRLAEECLRRSSLRFENDHLKSCSLTNATVAQGDAH